MFTYYLKVSILRNELQNFLEACAPYTNLLNAILWQSIHQHKSKMTIENKKICTGKMLLNNNDLIKIIPYKIIQNK